jgi:hypothetical protein
MQTELHRLRQLAATAAWQGASPAVCDEIEEIAALLLDRLPGRSPVGGLQLAHASTADDAPAAGAHLALVRAA